MSMRQLSLKLFFSKSIIILASPNGNIMGINEMAYKILGLPHYAADDDYENNEFNL